MSTIITSSPLFKAMKRTLDNIVTDDMKYAQVCIGKGKLVTMEKMEDGYVEDLEVAGTTYLEEKPQGQAMATDTVTLGSTVRHIPRTFAKKVVATAESIEDNKYTEIIKAGRRLMNSAHRTQDADVANLIINSTSAANPVGFDNMSLANSAHKLVRGGTYSNLLSIYATPSQAALMLAKAQLGLMPNQAGLVEPRRAVAIVCPLAQEDIWKIHIGSEKRTETNFNDINIVKDYKLRVLPIFHLDAASTTQWGLLTDAEVGFRCLERRPIKSRNWVDEDKDVLFYSVSYRLGLGVSDPRCWFQGDV